VSLFKRKVFSEAFHAFTEAIRLCPTKAVYHCNRSMAALKIGKHDIALADAENALTRDPSSLKALLRAALACLGLRKNDKSSSYFKRVLALDPSHKVLSTRDHGMLPSVIYLAHRPRRIIFLVQGGGHLRYAGNAVRLGQAETAVVLP
jgi:tetratricopeptide (TPR) repeat protein